MSAPLEVDCQAVKAMLDSGEAFLLLDCREPSEYQTAKLEPARLIPMSQLESRLEELTPHRDERIVVHCHHGGRSLRVTHWLRSQGFARVSSMAGGIDQWSLEIDSAIPRY